METDPLLRAHRYLASRALASGIPSLICGFVAAPLAAGLLSALLLADLTGSRLVAVACIALGALATLLNLVLTFEPPARS